MNIAIISGSTRTNRNSHRVSLALEAYLNALGCSATVLDVMAAGFENLNQLFSEMESPTQALQHFSNTLKSADAIVLVSPEYNGSYSGPIKNAVDHFNAEYKKKPIGVASVSVGGGAGMRAALSLQQLVLGIGGYALPRMLTVGNVTDRFDAQGNILNESTEKMIKVFAHELLFLTEAVKNQKAKATVA